MSDRNRKIFDFGRLTLVGLASLLAGLVACGTEPEPTAISLVDRFANARVENAVASPEAPAGIHWSFEGSPETPDWEALHGIEGLELRDGHLVGRTTEVPILLAPGPENPDPGDFFHAIEIDLRASKGTRLGVSFESDEELDREKYLKSAKRSSFSDFNIELVPGDELQTYTLSSANARFSSSYPLAEIRHVLVRPTDAADAEFEIAAMRLISLKEHLASIPSGIGWQGLEDVYRETLVSRSPERVSFDIDLPSKPFLDLAIGTVDHAPVTFRVEAGVDGSLRTLLQRTVTTPQRWHLERLELAELGGRRAALTLSLQAETPGTPGFWGSPVIRNRAGSPTAIVSSPARSTVVGDDVPPPRGVILIIADTLRRDHLQPYGYERPTAPVITRLAGEGALFRDAIAQGTWTKVSASSILTSLYPTTHGIRDMPDRLPAAVTTLAEAYRGAGYATFATSSVPFTGKLTNLHQGVEVLHESTSMPELDHSGSKTSRTYVDRLLAWLEAHHEVPFFAFLHVFDPHSPFEPYRPYDSIFLKPVELVQHREHMEKVKEFIEHGFMRYQMLPSQRELEAAGIDMATFVGREKAWYDASIRGMDAEVGRLIERLEHLGLADDTLIAFVSDHGEEFLEHGRHFHGYHVYGEMLNVPLILWWPKGIAGGAEIADTVQTIDLMPTLLELSRLPVPERAQGQSLLPLLAEANPTSLGWSPRPAFAERAYAPAAFENEDPLQLDSLAVVDGDWKLIKNTGRPEGWPEYELYDHRDDPLNLVNVADKHPEIVERLGQTLDRWHRSALEARVETEAAADELSPEEIEKLRSLGYIQ
jgi:arylsulfatase A-like enzyme